MKLYLVRHTHAGSRSSWDGPDTERPLTTKGHRQAAAIGQELAGVGVTALVSSPYRRCIQTLEPLATHLALPVVSDARVLCPDMTYMTPEDKARQADAARAAGRADLRRARLYVPPTLVIESVSPGHEQHDERTKRRWYAEFGVPNYWILNAFDRTLRCLVLQTGAYRDDAVGRDADEVKPSAFPGLVIPLMKVWPE